MDPIPMAESFPTMCEIVEVAECLMKNLRTSTSTSEQQELKSMSSQQTKDHLSVLIPTSVVYEVVQHVATEMASGLVVSDEDDGDNSGGSRTNNNNPGPQLDYTVMTDMVNGGGDISELAAQVAIQVTDGLQLVPVNSPVAPTQGGHDNDNHYDNFSINIDPIDEEPSTRVVSSVQLSQALWTVALLTLAIDIGTALYKPARGMLFGHNKLAYYLTLIGIFFSGIAEALIAVWLSHSHEVDKRCFLIGRVVLCASIVPFVAIIGIGGFSFMEG
ncbi:hypothetical protein VPH35_057930 [Triticum aestivum]